MKKILYMAKSYIFPKTDKETKHEIDILNTKNIHYVSLTVGIIQLISLVVFIIVNGGLGDSGVFGAFLRVGSSVLLCLCGYVISGMLLKKPEAVKNHPNALKVFIGGFIILMIIWSMFASINSYVNHQQILTFYTVELLAVLFVKLHPLFSTAIILSSYTAFYLILNFGFIEGLINPYNYFMLSVLSLVGAVINYKMTINYISEKNKAIILNQSLEIIANHDSITRLQNRYALNQHVPDYIGTDICVAMGDINSFKAVNDTYGHSVGDDVLKIFSDILLRYFPREALYRYGGDEFLIIESDCGIEQLNEKLRLVNETFSSVRVSNVQTGLSCSFGSVAAHPLNPTELFAALAQADQKLYKEKNSFKAKNKT